jgi:hypothetical protein
MLIRKSPNQITEVAMLRSSKKIIIVLVSLSLLGISHFAFKNFYLQPMAKAQIIDQHEKWRKRECERRANDDNIIENFSPDCVPPKELLVNCAGELDQNAFEWWWTHKGKEEIFLRVNDEYRKRGKNFEALKEWMACQGFVFIDIKDEMQITSPVVYGYGLFEDSSSYLPYGQGLYIHAADELHNALSIKVLFNTL